MGTLVGDRGYPPDLFLAPSLKGDGARGEGDLMPPLALFRKAPCKSRPLMAK